MICVPLCVCSRLLCVGSLFPGGTSRSQLDAAAATAAELGLELAPVELQYTAAFDFGSMSFRVVDPSAAAEDAVHVKAEVRRRSTCHPLLLLLLFPQTALVLTGTALRKEGV